MSESITRVATRSVCLRKSCTFCSSPPTFGCSVFLDPPINRFVWKRRIFSKIIAAKKHHTRPHALVTFPVTICFKIHAPSPSGINSRPDPLRDPTRSETRNPICDPPKLPANVFSLHNRKTTTIVASMPPVLSSILEQNQLWLPCHPVPSPMPSKIAMPPRALSYIKTSHSEHEI
uniref:Uncharacterized protein n=1 Tax=Fagus sylvatica TaxID=28930 RepID=A0A2N9I1N2_FAGSY